MKEITFTVLRKNVTNSDKVAGFYGVPVGTENPTDVKAFASTMPVSYAAIRELEEGEEVRVKGNYQHDKKSGKPFFVAHSLSVPFDHTSDAHTFTSEVVEDDGLQYVNGQQVDEWYPISIWKPGAPSIFETCHKELCGDRAITQRLYHADGSVMYACQKHWWF